MSESIKQAIEALRECLSTLSDFGLESSDAYQQALAALQAMQGEAAPQPAVPEGLHQMIVDYIREDFESLQDGDGWCLILLEEVEEQLKYLRKHDLLIQHPTDPERVMVAMLSAARGRSHEHNGTR